METQGREITPLTMTNTSKEFVVCFPTYPSSQIITKTNCDTYTMVEEGREGVLLVGLVVRENVWASLLLQNTLMQH